MAFDERIARRLVERGDGRQHAGRGMAAVHHALEHLLSEESGLRARLREKLARPLLVPRQFLIGEGRMQQHVRGEIEQVIELVAQARPAHRRFLSRDAGSGIEAGGHHLELLRDFLGRPGGGAFAHQRGGERREAGVIGRVVITARARYVDRERHLRQPMILEHHQVQAVRKIGLRRLRQLHRDDLAGNWHFPFLHQALGRRLLLWRHLLRRHPGREEQGGRESEKQARGAHYSPPLPAAGLGFVTTTLRLSFVKYSFATRCTSAAVILSSRW